MKIYIAGIHGVYETSQINQLLTNSLVTFWEKPKFHKCHREQDIFLDSGAFSAWSRKKSIDLKDYIRYVKENEEWITVYANLDVIGSARRSWRNQMKMEKAGLKPMPVFHTEDEPYWLEKCVNEYEMFCIGGMAKGFSRKERQSFLDRSFELVEKLGGLDRCKIHGFGMTSFDLMWRYPWYSVDSTTAVLVSGMGGIIVPPRRNGEWRYDLPPHGISISEKSPSAKKLNEHYTTVPPTVKQMIDDYLTENEYSFKDCAESYLPRRELNIIYYNTLQDAITEKGSNWDDTNKLIPLL